MDGFRETIQYTFRGKGKLIFKIVIFYLVKTRRKRVRISHEHEAYAWHPYRDALKLITYHNSKGVLERAHRFINKTSLENATAC